eukprot:GFUD01078022.1.p1 GENE.GFUD01078022.1~~GFUD01078022.1.p1  ORF type:complete len:168 (+),score=41.92 GFUD01078022.1:45-548(+)
MVAMNTIRFRTIAAVLKIIELVIILALLMVIRFGGKDGNPMFLGSVDATFFGYGTVVGFSCVVPAVLVTYCVGGDPSHVELLLNCLGGVMFCALGSVAVLFDQGSLGDKKNMEKLLTSVLENLGASTSFNEGGTLLAVGILSILAGFVFLADLGFIANHPKLCLRTK